MGGLVCGYSIALHRSGSTMIYPNVRQMISGCLRIERNTNILGRPQWSSNFPADRAESVKYTPIRAISGGDEDHMKYESASEQGPTECSMVTRGCEELHGGN